MVRVVAEVAGDSGGGEGVEDDGIRNNRKSGGFGFDCLAEVHSPRGNGVVFGS